MTNITLTTIATAFPVFCLIFNIILLIATIHNRKNSTLPFAYMIVMSVNGIILSVFVSLHMSIYLALSEESYKVYLEKFGRETTLGGTFSYLNYLMVNVVMTINRVVVVARPFNEMFTTAKVFIYCLLTGIVTFISLYIPYSGPCNITFDVSKLLFVSGCAPGRHPITLFQNTYAINLPVGCMFVNLGIILHLINVRHGRYKKIKLILKGIKPKASNYSTETLQSTTMSKIQERRDTIMLKQTIYVAIYLSIYEFGALFVKLFSNFYASWPPAVRDGYFLFRMASIPAMNFIIYYVETGSTRRMLRRFLHLKTSDTDSAFHATAVGPAPLPTVSRSDVQSAAPIN
ncbi:hypothetical protein CAEBREN_03157 [Caenorhabditis brenneri]|uniref:G-protein coupled receptors family 1 profile domain-containing protein n=1 Tax=Caenorhabditis brenneri TaxID=135651 RepID=G0MAQ3_CAEBE|nr:hypothetical protein CAEBREN_03157 [Caenorhabditis brenneri]